VNDFLYNEFRPFFKGTFSFLWLKSCSNLKSLADSCLAQRALSIDFLRVKFILISLENIWKYGKKMCENPDKNFDKKVIKNIAITIFPSFRPRKTVITKMRFPGSYLFVLTTFWHFYFFFVIFFIIFKACIICIIHPLRIKYNERVRIIFSFEEFD
jgi:hypothetical protein